MSEEMLELKIDKFTFLIPKALMYGEEGVWVKLDGNRARLGLSDFAQQRSGDIVFAKVRPVGTPLESGDEFADIETVKVDVSLPSPVKGTIVEVNPCLNDAAELINQDPYGRGWLAIVELGAGESADARLLNADAYLALVKDLAEAEIEK